jgi:hypothetical protein
VPATDHHVGRHEAGQLAVVVVFGVAGERTGLVKGRVVEQPLDALADGQFARRALTFDALGAAHPARELLPPAQLVELGLPCHRKAVCRTTAR